MDWNKIKAYTQIIAPHVSDEKVLECMSESLFQYGEEEYRGGPVQTLMDDMSDCSPRFQGIRDKYGSGTFATSTQLLMEYWAKPNKPLAVFLKDNCFRKNKAQSVEEVPHSSNLTHKQTLEKKIDTLLGMVKEQLLAVLLNQVSLEEDNCHWGNGTVVQNQPMELRLQDEESLPSSSISEVCVRDNKEVEGSEVEEHVKKTRCEEMQIPEIKLVTDIIAYNVDRSDLVGIEDKFVKKEKQKEILGKVVPEFPLQFKDYDIPQFPVHGKYRMKMGAVTSLNLLGARLCIDDRRKFMLYVRNKTSCRRMDMFLWIEALVGKMPESARGLETSIGFFMCCLQSCSGNEEKAIALYNKWLHWINDQVTVREFEDIRALLPLVLR